MPIQDHDDLLAALAVSDLVKLDLVGRMNGPNRHYHSMRHLALLWERHGRFARRSGMDLTPFSSRIAAAIAFHDSVYVGGAKDNEERSAMLWLEISSKEAALGETDRQWVAETIRATAGHLTAGTKLDLANPSDYAKQWVLDLDLTPLGEPPQVFDDNMALLLAENPQANLIAGIRHYAGAERLYRCEPIANAFQEAARANFARHLRNAVEED